MEQKKITHSRKNFVKRQVQWMYWKTGVEHVSFVSDTSLECMAHSLLVCHASWNFCRAKFLTHHKKSEKRSIRDMYSVQLLLCRYTLWCQSNVIRKIALQFNPPWYALSRPTIYCITACNLKILFFYNTSKYCFKFFETCPVIPRYRGHHCKRHRFIRDI